MVYSTCTLNREENEMILEWAIQELEIELLDIELTIKNTVPAISENSEVKKALRILPSKETEGFFVAKLKKLSL